MTFHHIGYAVKNLSTAVKNFELLGFRISSDPFLDKNRKVCIQLMKTENNTILELVSPALEGSPIDSFLQNTGPGCYHLCFVTDDIVKDKEFLSDLKFKTIIDIEKAPALGNCRVIFLYNKEIGLIELAEFDKVEEK